jgi:hypothetical protein
MHTCDLYSPVHNVLDGCIYITWGSGRGLGPGIPEFFGSCAGGDSHHAISVIPVLGHPLYTCEYRLGALAWQGFARICGYSVTVRVVTLKLL